MNDFDQMDSPLLDSSQIIEQWDKALKETLKLFFQEQMRGSDFSRCLYASLMTMFDAGFAAALKLEKDEGESSTVA